MEDLFPLSYLLRQPRSKTRRGRMLPQWEVVGSWGMAGTDAERSLRDQGAGSFLEKSPRGWRKKRQKVHYICQLKKCLSSTERLWGGTSKDKISSLKRYPGVLGTRPPAEVKVDVGVCPHHHVNTPTPRE